MPSRVPVTACFLLSSVLLACGGRADLGAGESACPEGFTCVPACVGPACDDASTSTFQPPAVDDAGVDLENDATSSLPDYPDGSIPPSSATMVSLGYNVVDAKLSPVLSSLVLVSDSPSNALHVYSVVARTDVSIPLPSAPVAVSVDATGLMAAVAYDAHVSWIDLQAHTIKATCDLSSDSSDIALTTAGVAYVAPETDQWVYLRAIDLTTCTETLESQLYAGARLALDPDADVLFATQDLDPSSILRCDLTASPIVCSDSEEGADWGMYDYGNNVWPSADGTRLYTGGGTTLLIPDDAGGGLYTYGGTLEGVTGVQTLSEAPKAGRVALVPGVSFSYFDQEPTIADTVVRVHETQYLGLIAQYELPYVSGNAEHGKFVFATSTMDSIYVVAQAESADDDAGVFSIVRVVP